MKRTLIFITLLALFTSGCGKSSTLQATLPASLVPAAPATTVSRLEPVAPTPLQGGTALPGAESSWVLEMLSVENAAQIQLLSQIGEGVFEDSIRISPDGHVLAAATSGGVLLMDATNGQRLDFYPSHNAVDSLDFSPDGNYLTTIHREPGEKVMTTGETAGAVLYHPVLTLRDLSNGERIYQRNLSGTGCGQYAAWDVDYSPDGSTLAFRDYYSWLGHDRADNLCLLSSADGSLIRRILIDLPWETTSPALFSADGKWLVVAVVDQSTAGFPIPTTRIRVYDVTSGSLAQEFDGFGMITDLALSQSGEQVAVADQQGARLISARDGGLITSFGNHAREVKSLAFSPDGFLLALGSLDGTVSLWSVPEGSFLWQTQAWIAISPILSESMDAEIWDVAFSPDGRIVYALAPSHTIYTPGRITALQASDGIALFSIYGNSGASRPGLSPDHSRLAFGGYEDGLGQVWSTAENRVLFELKGHASMILNACFSSDGGHIATGSMDGTVRLWNASDGSLVATLAGHTGAVRVAQFSPDGARLVSIADDGVLRQWSVGDGSLLREIETQTGGGLANTLAFSRDGKIVLLAAGCPYSHCSSQTVGGLRKVDLESGQIDTLISLPVYSITFSTNQSAFALYNPQGIQSGRADAGIYQVQHAYTSPMGNGHLMGEAITPDGGLFFSGNGFGLHVWNAATGEMLALIKSASEAYGVIWVTPEQHIVLTAAWNGLISLWGVPVGD